MLAVVLLGGLLYRMLPGVVGEPQPESVAVEEARVAYAGDYLLGEPAWFLYDSRPAQEVAEEWLPRDAFVDGSADVLLQWDQVSKTELDHHERRGTEVRVVDEGLGDHTRYADVTPVESALAGVDPDDVHPAAARCLREQGVL